MWPRTIIACSVSLAVGCSDDPLIGEVNEAPIAEAKVILNGAAMEQARDGSIAALTFPFAGEPVTVTLDGTGSRDPDGKIAGYRWLSGTRIADAGVPRPWSIDAGAPEPFWRWTPTDQGLPWPSAVAAPSVELGEGTWAFTLSVVDEQGAWSSPDTIRFIVGRPGGAGGDASVAPPAGAGLDAGADGGR